MPDYRDIVKQLISGPESNNSHYDSSGRLIKNKMGSSALGKYQIINDTWNRLSSKYRKKSGRPLDRSSTSDHEIAMDLLLDENAGRLKSMGVPVNAVTLYGMHVKGSSWVKKAITNPNAPIGSAFTQDEISKNPTYLGKSNKTLGDTMRVLTSKINDSAKKLNIPAQANPIKNSKAYNMDETQQQYVNFRKELSAAKQKYSGTELDKVQSNIVKKYKDQGLVPAFNELQGRINNERVRSYRSKAEGTFNLANNLGSILQGDTGKRYTDSVGFEYEIKNKKTFIPRDSKIPLGRFSEQELKTFEEISGKKVDKKSGGIPTSYFLKTIQNNLKTYTGENINLINNDNSRGKDLMFEGTKETNNVSLSKPHSNISTNVYIGNPKNKEGGFTGMFDSSYEKRNFQYNPETMKPQTLNAIDYDSDTWDVSPDELNTDISTDSGFQSTPPVEYSPTSYNPQKLSYYQTPDSKKENDRYKELLNKKVAERTPAENEELKRLSENKQSTDGMNTMMRAFQDADAPQQYSYDPSTFKPNIPVDQMATAMFGIISGSAMADNELKMRDEQVSAAYMSYASELQRLSEIGLKPEDEAYAKRMLSESYSSGVDQIVRASNGNRNLVLGNLGRVDYQKQQGLLQIAMADAQASNEAFYKYGEAMKYISEFDANRDITNNERKYQNDMQQRQVGAQLMSQGWKSLMDGIQYYQDNKPGSANHAYKSYMMQSMFKFDPDKKDDGSGTEPGTKSYWDKQQKDNMVRYLQNKDMADQYFSMSQDKQQMFNQVANEKGWGEDTKGFLNYISKNDVSGLWNIDKYDEAKQNGDYSQMFSPTDAQKQDVKYVNKEIPQPDKMFSVSENELSPVNNPKDSSVILNNSFKAPSINFDLLPNSVNAPKNNSIGSDLFKNIEMQANQNKQLKAEAESFLSNQQSVVSSILQDQRNTDNELSKIDNFRRNILLQ